MGNNYKPDAYHLDASELNFMVLCKEEIKRISVVKVISSLTFDILGQSMPGGLYDSAMGPYHFSGDPCSTCMQSYTNCRGHLGHIELTMTAFNPFFLGIVYKILRITCFKCFKVQLSDQTRRIYELQLRLIDAGYIIEAQQIEIYKSNTVTQNPKEEEKPYSEGGTIVSPLIRQYEEMLDAEPTKQKCPRNKNMEELRNLIENVILKCGTKKCIHCKEPMKNVKMTYGKLVIQYTKAEMLRFYENEAIHEDTNVAEKVRLNNKIVIADECCKYLRKMFPKQSTFFKLVFPVLNYVNEKLLDHPTDLFFMDLLPVLPPLVRPCNLVGNKTVEHPQTMIYKDIIVANTALSAIIMCVQVEEEKIMGATHISDEAKNVYNNTQGATGHEKIYNAWQDLQTCINSLMDTSSDTSRKGLKQIIEKKAGIIRMNMMGKRVDYAARTVITPDPNINVDEIGIPEVFAKKLTFPTPVTNWNIQELRKMVINGPDVYPGANFIEMDFGKKVIIPANNVTKRESLAKLLSQPVDQGIKIVYRHLRNGDFLLVNRQPTLHRPSIQAHKARILKGEKTFRMHYSNCKAYNADFDGDEMNAHLPQNLLGQSEAANLTNVANNYLVPKDGTPLGGLIQDYMIAGVRLSMRGRFFNREDYQHLVYQGLSLISGNIELVPPAILKPVALWSGKQVFSTIFINLMPKEKSQRINIKSRAKIPANAWNIASQGKTKFQPSKFGGTQLKGNDMTESEVIIREGELLVGVLDKMHYGATPYGLVHSMYELYGGECASRLLSSLAKCFMVFLQWEGFTLGVYDILVVAEADKKRRNIIKNCRKSGYKIAAETLNLPEDVPLDIFSQKLEDAYANDSKFRVILDRAYKSTLNNFTNDINNACLPTGLVARFPENNLQLMVQSGAKGSTVNTMQISCLLGQIELEGKRPPLMISGKSLPSFATFETSPMSGGFIDSRFMTGIKPQEFFFHCMAGREGLIDTAVKTSRSGYLQRCLIKHLEGVTVNYDMTVRDSDNSVIQFMYGEDGLDIAQAQFLKPETLDFLISNYNVIVKPELLDQFKNDPAIDKKIKRYSKKIRSWCKDNGLWSKRRMSGFQQFSKDIKPDLDLKNPNKMKGSTGRRKIDSKIIKLWTEADEERRSLYAMKFQRCPDPLVSKFKPDHVFGSTSEYLQGLIANYAQSHNDKKNEIKNLINVKTYHSYAPPGESVGLLAAQSIGEPSTQMTLNTFHFAGRGEMNVTLGIPRLREILMMASVKIKTPSMDIPFYPVDGLTELAEKTRLRMVRVSVADVLETVVVKTCLRLKPNRIKHYCLRFNFLPYEAYSDRFSIKPKKIINHMMNEYIKLLFKAMALASKTKNFVVDLGTEKSKTKRTDDFEDKEIDDKLPNETASNKKKTQDSDESSDDEAEDVDADATAGARKRKGADTVDYESAEEIDDNASEVGAGSDQETNKGDDVDDDSDSDSDDEDTEALSKVLKGNNMVQKFIYDTKSYLWCELTFDLSMKYRDIDLSSIIKDVSDKSVIYQVPQIKRAITYSNDKNDLILKTEGINIHEMCKFNEILNLNKLYTNDIHAMARTYGIEAARQVIVTEVQNVFNVYGITVNARHLLLIADYMTFDGTIRALNRTGMKHASSPLQKMTFESSLMFLKDATVFGRKDAIKSPSSRLILGQPLNSGTGSFSLITDCNFMLNSVK